MSKNIKLKKGLDIKLVGEAEKNITRLPLASHYGISPSEFEGVVPKLLVKTDDVVKAGSPLFFDKSRPRIVFTSPVSGRISAVNRGEKRKILEIVVEADRQQTCAAFEVKPPKSSTREEIIELLLASGLWPYIIQRPFGIIAEPSDTPKSIFVSGFDSAPLAPDMNFALSDQFENLRTGVEVLKKLTTGKVHLGLRGGTEGVLDMLTGAEQTRYYGPHPAGNVGVQIHHTDPVNKGETVWTVDIQSLAVIGRFFNTGKPDMTRVYAVTGSEVSKPAYVSMLPGTPVAAFAGEDRLKKRKGVEKVRIINGNVLTGKTVAADGYAGFYANQITVIPEGDKYELLGWAMPRLNKFSVSRGYFSWLTPNRKYVLDTNINGGERSFIMSGIFEKYVPMDIYPMYLLKAILAEDIDKMENLGIYEVVEEDFALCEYVDPSKNDIQQIVRDGINLIIKELS